MADAEGSMTDKLLKLVEEGDATAILAREYRSSLNELIKHELISMDEDRLKLTEKGRKAMLMGADLFLMDKKPATDAPGEHSTLQKINVEGSNQSLIIILFFLLISLLTIFVMAGQEIK